MTEPKKPGIPNRNPAGGTAQNKRGGRAAPLSRGAGRARSRISICMKITGTQKQPGPPT